MLSRTVYYLLLLLTMKRRCFHSDNEPDEKLKLKSASGGAGKPSNILVDARLTREIKISPFCL